ncbi:hypothetical protein [Nonomuraea sp. NPDC049480]|uniref:hypothetical protein n=1 Tax=Nonomuraea sp. NPDC049480 TaxID=3364353 RepID=UPI00378D24BC
MRARRTVALAACSFLALIAGCTSGASVENAGKPPPRPPRILNANGDRALIFDPMMATISGFDRIRGRVWQDREIAKTANDIVCVLQCRAVVVSTGAGAKGGLYQVAEQGRSAFPVSGVRDARVLAAVSTDDAVVEETVGGRTRITLIRSGQRKRLELPHSGYRWVESPDGRAALAFTVQPDVREARLLQFVRDSRGWNPVGNGIPWGPISDACVAGQGDVVLVLGAETTLIRAGNDRRKVDPSLAEARECALGTSAAALVSRATNDRGDFRTVVHGLDMNGRMAWRRDYPSEAGVTAHPNKPYVGIADGRTFTIVDARGQNVWARDGVAAARFTSGGQLVTVSPKGEVTWLSTELLKDAYRNS